MARNSFLVFDVETPNRRQDRICQLGMVRVYPGEKHPVPRGLLIDPEAPFDDVCVSVHGIEAQHVYGKPTFPDLWSQGLKEIFESSVLVAHNAAFDLSVLSKTLAFYRIPQPEIVYMDTLELAKSFYPGLPNYKLPVVCEHVGFPLANHHDAGADAEAAYHVLDETLRRFGAAALAPRTYNSVLPVKEDPLEGMRNVLASIAADGRVDFQEALELRLWMDEHQEVLPAKLYDKFASLLFEVLYDGQIDADEERTLLSEFRDFTQPAEATSERVDLAGKTCVLTGDFKHGSKAAVTDHISAAGGVVKSGVTKKTDYVIIGSYGSERYNFGTYGGKVLRARELQEQGLPIQIISEDALY
ncbi:MAG: hypothetical protein LBR21_05260 [Propionibacteriaceae bacterium]|jgi:DNA polymerase-3 subunit epsilon|nr:hypothetical protein [Propionibacteriaceae bacterium]